MLLVWAVGLTVLAGLFAMTDSALSRVSAARAAEMAREGVRGARPLQAAAADVVRHLNLLLLLRTIGRQHAYTVGRYAAPFVLWLGRVLGPLARLLILVGNAVTPGRGFRDGPFSTTVELR